MNQTIELGIGWFQLDEKKMKEKLLEVEICKP